MVRERIVITRTLRVENGSGGSADGTPTTVLDTKALVREIKPSRTLEALQLALKRAIVCEFWKQAGLELMAGDTLTWNSQKWTLQGPALPKDSIGRIYVITALEQ